MVDSLTKTTVQKIPLLTVRAGPRDGDEWVKRLKQELKALIAVRSRQCCTVRPVLCLSHLRLQYLQMNKQADNDWFKISSNKEGTQCVIVLHGIGLER